MDCDIIYLWNCDYTEIKLIKMFLQEKKCLEGNYMGFKWDKKYLHWGVTAFCVLAAAILLQPNSLAN